MENLVVRGTFFTSKNKDEVVAHENYLICIDNGGLISRTLSPSDREYHQVLAEAQQHDRLLELKDNPTTCSSWKWAQRMLATSRRFVTLCIHKWQL